MSRNDTLDDPLTRHREPDLQYIEQTTEAMASTLRVGQLICLESMLVTDHSAFDYATIYAPARTPGSSSTRGTPSASGASSAPPSRRRERVTVLRRATFIPPSRRPTHARAVNP